MRLRIRTNTKRIRKLMESYPDEIHEALVVGLRRGSEIVVKQAQLNLTTGGNVFMGQLRASMGYIVHAPGLRAVIGPGLGIQSRSSTTGNPRNYGQFVEEGRGPGKAPPIGVMRLWVKRKIGASGDGDINQIAYRISRHIGRKGTKPHPYLAPAVRAVAPKVMQRIQNELDKKVAELNNRGRA